MKVSIKCLLLLICVFVLEGCGILDSSDNHPPPVIPDKLILLTTVFGQGQGIWTFDPQNLEVQDTLETGSTWSINFSPDYRTVYSAWRDRDTEPEISQGFAIDKTTGEIINQQELWNSHLQIDRTGNYLISMGGIQPGIQVLDVQTFDIVFEGYTQFINRRMAQVAASPVENKVFALVEAHGESGTAGVMIFNYENYEVEAIIPLTDDEDRRQSMQGVYIDISPDGRFIYSTVFNWQGGGGFGSFHVIDLEKGKQVFESSCGGFAWIGVSPDGRHVYLSDSAGTPFHTVGISYEFIPTNEILRYDVKRRQMETFARGGSDFGLSGTENDLLITSSIAVAPDSRSMFIRVLSAGMTDEGISPRIIHVDTRTKELINVYTQPPDPDGFVRSLLHQLKIGFRPD